MQKLTQLMEHVAVLMERLSRAKVTQVMSYLKLPQNVREMLDNGSLPGSTAYAISRAPDESTQQALLRDAVNGKLKRDDASNRVGRKRESRPSLRSVFRLKNADITIASANGLKLDEIVDVCQQLIKECRRVSKQGIDVTTLERILNDQRRTTA